MARVRWLIATALLATGPVPAEDLYVPNQFPTLQAAVDASHDGDRIYLFARGQTAQIAGRRLTIIGFQEAWNPQWESPQIKGTGDAPGLSIISGSSVELRNLRLEGQDAAFAGEGPPYSATEALHLASSELIAENCRFVGGSRQLNQPGVTLGQEASATLTRCLLMGGSGEYFPPRNAMGAGRPGLTALDASSLTCVDSALYGGTGYVPGGALASEQPGDGGDGLPALSVEGVPSVRLARSTLLGGRGGSGGYELTAARGVGGVGGPGLRVRGPSRVLAFECSIEAGSNGSGLSPGVVPQPISLEDEAFLLVDPALERDVLLGRAASSECPYGQGDAQRDSRIDAADLVAMLNALEPDAFESVEESEGAVTLTVPGQIDFRNLHAPEDADFFRCELDQPRWVRIQALSSHPAIGLEAYRLVSGEVEVLSISSGVSPEVSGTLATGEYFLRVHDVGFDDPVLNYSMTVEAGG